LVLLCSITEFDCNFDLPHAVDTRYSWDLRSSEILAAYIGSSLLTFRDNLSVPSSRVKVSWKVGKELPLHDIPDERRSHLLRGGSLKLLTGLVCTSFRSDPF